MAVMNISFIPREYGRLTGPQKDLLHDLHGCSGGYAVPRQRWRTARVLARLGLATFDESDGVARASVRGQQLIARLDDEQARARKLLSALAGVNAP